MVARDCWLVWRRTFLHNRLLTVDVLIYMTHDRLLLNILARGSERPLVC